MINQMGCGLSARWAARRSAVAVIALLAIALPAVTACDSGAFHAPATRPDDSVQNSTNSPLSSASAVSTSTRPAPQPDGLSDQRSTNSARATSPPSRRPKPQYHYSLPEGDTSHADENGVMYAKLSAGRCAEAQAHLDYSWPWGYQSPEEVIMFQVGASMCAGDGQRAGVQFDRGKRLYGWAGVATFGRNLCNIYRAYLGYRDQRPPSDIPCPGGEIVYWPGWPSHQARDDPRTDAVEAASSNSEDYTPPGQPDASESLSGTTPPAMPPTTTRIVATSGSSGEPGMSYTSDPNS